MTARFSQASTISQQKRLFFDSGYYLQLYHGFIHAFVETAFLISCVENWIYLSKHSCGKASTLWPYGMIDCRIPISCSVKVLNLSFVETQHSTVRSITENAQMIGQRNKTPRKVFRGIFPLQNEESAFVHTCILICAIETSHTYHCYFRQLLMMLKLVFFIGSG